MSCLQIQHHLNLLCAASCQIKTIQYYQWFLQTAERFNKVDTNLSEIISEKYRCEVKKCYQNCSLVVKNNPSTFKYYEGYVCIGKIPIPLNHAFIVKNNVVIDPTLGITGDRYAKQLEKIGLDDAKLLEWSDRYGDEYMGVHIPFTTLTKLKHWPDYLQNYYLWLQKRNRKKSTI